MLHEFSQLMWKIARSIFEAILRLRKPKTDSPKGGRRTPFDAFIGNKNAVTQLRRIANLALSGDLESFGATNIALIGPAGCGKTHLAKVHAEYVGLPLVTIQPHTVQSVGELVKRIESDLQMQFPARAKRTVTLPPSIIFVDEVHALNKKIVHALLTAVESNDATLTYGKLTLDFSKVQWIVATTERGRLFGPFETRFMKIRLSRYTVEEMASIVKLRYRDVLPGPVCEAIGHISPRIPRETLQLALMVKAERLGHPDKPWHRVVADVAESLGYVPGGLKRKEKQILELLAEGPVSMARMATRIGVQTEELENYLMPELMEQLPGREPLISVSNRGLELTPAGKEWLDTYGKMSWHRYLTPMREALEKLEQATPAR